MNIDLSPIPALAPEACGPAAFARGQGKTLTLQLALGSAPTCDEAMSGIVIASESLACCPNPLRAAVVPAEGLALTITF